MPVSDDARRDATSIVAALAQAVGSDLLARDDVALIDIVVARRIDEIYSDIPARRARVTSALMASSGTDEPGPVDVVAFAGFESLEAIRRRRDWDDSTSRLAKARLDQFVDGLRSAETLGRHLMGGRGHTVDAPIPRGPIRGPI